MSKDTGRINRGKELEVTILASQGDAVRLTQLGATAKFLPPVHASNPGGARRPRIIARKGPVDFIGTCRSSVPPGRGIHFDAKRCSDINGFNVRSHLEPHQEEHLARHGEAGAIAGLLMEATYPTVRAYFWADWQLVARHFRQGPPVIRWDEPGLIRLGDGLYNIPFGEVPGVRT